MPRLTAGIVAMSSALAAGTLGLTTAAPLAQAAVAWALFAAAMALYLFVQRVGAAGLCAWPLAAVYLGYLFYAGSFAWHPVLIIGLVVLGVLLGALLPTHSLILVAPALGTVLLAVAWPADPGFSRVVVLFVIALLWQAVGLRVLFPPRHLWSMNRTELRARRREQWRRAVIWGAGALLAGLVVFALLVPRVSGPGPRTAKRWARLQGTGALGRPGIIASPASAFYLSGRAWPIALVSEQPRLLDRLTVLVRGRGIGRDIDSLRTIKDADEIAAMRRAGAITSQAFADVAPLIRRGVKEAELENAILRSFAAHGATGLAFPCIVASGANATQPHYQANLADLTDGLVVIDIGCSVDYYASDQTRTFPVRGRWTPAERRLLAAVLEAKEKARSALRPGVRHSELDRIAKEVVTKGGFEKYWLHSLGHHVGLDVHDPGADLLQAGMVVTIEPGLYIPAGAPIERAYWNLGVRVEDTYLVTAAGSEALTSFSEAPELTLAPGR